MPKLYHIQISQHFNFPPKTELFSVLEQLLSIKFILGEQEGIKLEGVIISDGRANKDAANIPSLSLLSPAGPANKSQQIETEVKFADDPDVPFPFRGRTASAKLAQTGHVLSVHTHEKVLASSEQRPIWSVSAIDGVKRFRSALPLPYISAEQNFNDVFNGEHFMEMLVLLEFIREISTKTTYRNAPLRASFIIDDPNLHWPQYGYVDYRETAIRAQKENYHVSFATIPLDTWYTHKATAELFRKNSNWLSLLIHGNNHAKEELALNYSDEMRKSLLRQAINRIKHLEEKANLCVSRVMVPPHGACSNEMLSELPNCGFESACISAGSLRAHNPGKPWTKTLGFFPSEIIEGCPVLPRWGLTGNVENTLLVAAYRGQPLILRGHHQDLKDGGGVFNEFAKFINSLGDVFWSNMTDLSRLNYLWRIDETICRVKPFGTHIVLKLPTQVTEMVIESPDGTSNDTWQVISNNGCIQNTAPGKSFLLSGQMGDEISIKRNAIAVTYHLSENFKQTDTKLILRRLMTEARDRLLV